MCTTKTVYYSTCCPLYEQENYIGSDVLVEVRRNFFKTGAKQKNKISQKCYEKVFNYSYLLEKNRPMQWKKMCDGKILEKSIPSKDGYAITSQNETNIKIIYFNPEHQWIRTQYFSKSGPKKVLLGMEAVDEKNVLFKEWDNKTNSYNTSILSAITLHETKGFLPIAPKAICYTDHGELLFYSDEQIAYYHKFMDKAKSQDKSLPPKSKSGLDKNNESITQINENFSKEKKLPNSNHFYSGQVSKENLRQGYGRTYTDSGCTIYEGTYKNDQKDGFGVSYYDNGNVSYVGNFSQNQRNGMGINFSYDKSLVRIGTWENGSPSDMTSIFDKTGTLIFAGKTLNNKRNGIGISYNSKKDKVLVGKWKNGLFTGNGTIFDFDGNVLLAGQISSEMLLEFNIHEKNV